MGNHYSVIVSWDRMEGDATWHRERAKQIQWGIQTVEPKSIVFVDMLESGTTAMECLLLFSMKDACVWNDRIWAAIDEHEWRRPERVCVMWRGEHSNKYTVAERGKRY